MASNTYDEWSGLLTRGLLLSPDVGYVPHQFAQDEQQHVNAWLRAQDLNVYGDPSDTEYLGGNPCFDEEGFGAYVCDSYSRLTGMFPTRPWNKPIDPIHPAKDSETIQRVASSTPFH
mmetsp:Transcript_17202/g.44498  ORF Transcript_17202/g.44498 Transcript_17202/m.44498 type:complete len:117 (+) Transcript_17202:87-437(+)